MGPGARRPGQCRPLTAGPTILSLATAELALALALDHLLDFALHANRELRRRRAASAPGLFARGALGLLAFCSVFNVLGIHSILIPAYFAINFFNPYPGKLTVTLASSPEPSSRTMVPRPYLACSMVEPSPVFFLRHWNGCRCRWLRDWRGYRLLRRRCAPFSAKN